jgi:hypothetical protein
MRYSKSITVLFASVVCATVFAADLEAQSRGRSGGGRSGSGRGPTVGRAVPRSGGGGRIAGRNDRGGRSYDGRSYGGRSYGGRSYGSRVIVAPRVFLGRSLRSYYYPYYGGYGYPYRSGLSIGFYGRYGYPYGYGSPYYGYPYGYSYGGYYPAGYGYGGYGYGGSGGYRGSAYGAVRIEGAVRNAEVYVDGYYAGIVDDFDGAFQRLELESGAHEIEIRAPGFPPLTYDVNVQPGQTLTLHANVR